MKPVSAIPPGPAPAWLRGALRLTTAPIRAEQARAIGIATPWGIRTATPRWACIWRGHPEAQCRLRTIVLPAPWSGWGDPVWQALLLHSLQVFGLSPVAPEPGLLLLAERRAFAALAPPWGRMMMRM
ncbi:hypothetical protein [Oceanicella sp. SM1341]|uniref:hypothetical protein n=1 Tax=Oceanicella sp. SM1341 TaxID=1548889 RepID=UPI000E48ECC1|nr:hypothetical protein [Oceanicella sp. SM1341]